MPSLSDWFMSCMIAGAKISAHSFSSLVGMISLGAVLFRRVPMIFLVASMEMGLRVKLVDCGGFMWVLDLGFREGLMEVLFN